MRSRWCWLSLGVVGLFDADESVAQGFPEPPSPDPIAGILSHLLPHESDQDGSLPELHLAEFESHSSVETSTDPASEVAEEGAGCARVDRVELGGDLAERFQWSLAAARDGGVPGCLDDAALEALRERIEGAIVERGFATTRVLAEPHDHSATVWRLTLVPGRIHDIRFVEAVQGRGGSMRQLNALPVRPGDLLNLRDLEQALENLRRLPSVEADIEVVETEDGTALPGARDVLIQFAQRSPVRFDLSGDDAGSRSTGTYLGNAALSLENLAQLNDLAYFNVNADIGGRDPGPRGTRSYAAYYSLPYGNWEVGVSRSVSRDRQSFMSGEESFLYRLRRDTSDVSLSRTIYRDPTRKTQLTLRGFAQSSSSSIDDVELEGERRRVRGFEVEAKHWEYAGESTLELGVSYRRATEAANSVGAALDQIGREVRHPAFVSFSAQWALPFNARDQRLDFSVELRGQVALTPIVSQDSFAIGGRSTVRGFDGENALFAEHGFTLHNELCWSMGSTGQALYVGADYGEVSGPSAAALPGRRLGGMVVGLRGSYGSWSYDTFVGQPLERPSGFKAAKQVTGFSFSWSF